MKWYGEICFEEEYEEEPGVWATKTLVDSFIGDVLKPSWKEDNTNKINSDLRVSNRISVVANAFIRNNFRKIAYITFEGERWTISNATIEDRRIIFDLGPLYTEEHKDEN